MIESNYYENDLKLKKQPFSYLQITTFLYDYLTTTTSSPLGLVPINSWLIYSPSRRQEVWRFLTYMLLHANWFHLGFNVFVQIVVGAPLELVHGSIRIACIYLAGVVAGSLGTSVVDSEVFLVGASGGVYALLAANLADIMINFSTVKFVTLKLLAILLFSSFDFAYAVYSNYCVASESSSTTISYIAHLTGALAGLTIGLSVLKNFEEVEVEDKENQNQRSVLWWCAFGAYFTFILFTVLFNLLNTMTAQMLEEEGETLIETTFTS
ncbi:RHBDL3.2 family protein [Megaselia abdita]